MHPLKIHSFASRSYRDPASLEEVWITVPVRYCGQAKALLRQYTERLLPDFLIPYARMRLDKLIRACRSRESGSSIEECCRILGCIDLRTARMHLKRIESAAKEAALVLAEKQAAAVHLHEDSYSLKPLTPLQRMEALFGLQEEARLRMGRDNGWDENLWTLLQTVLWKNRRKVLMSYVSRPPPDS